MNTKLLLTAVCAAAVLSGCGHLGKGMANDAEMLDKAEFATGIDRSQLSVVPVLSIGVHRASDFITSIVV